jgi:hypothetical protein
MRPYLTSSSSRPYLIRLRDLPVTQRGGAAESARVRQ